MLLSERALIDTADCFELEAQATFFAKSSDDGNPQPLYDLKPRLRSAHMRCGSLVLSAMRQRLGTRIVTRRRCNLRNALRAALWLTGAFILVSVLEALLYPSYQTPPKHYHTLKQTIRSRSSQAGRGNPDQEKIFIAANIINEDLIKGAWGDAVLELVDLLGEENVFVSVYENDSGDGTRNALRGFQAKLSCNSSVVTGDHISLSELPEVTMPSGEQRIKRIAYLAEVRNRALRPLDHTYKPLKGQIGFQHANMEFDRILFLNDIFFSAADAVQLLFSTNNGKYRAACAIDFVSSVMFYDSFVVRDTNGYGMGLMFFPWFAPTGSAQSRDAVLAEKDAVPARSCWGGMVAFDAEQFQEMSTPYTPRVTTRFRYEVEPFWEAAECCLIFADMEDAYGEPSIDQGTGVFVNPYIRVSYTRRTWDWLPFFQRYERIFRNLQYIVSKINYPEYNPRRLDKPGQLVEHNVWMSNQDTNGDSFQMLQRPAAPGGFCGQKRMFLMKRDFESANRHGRKNWEKVPVPW
ncbi:predicted protein [Uncinocarpus reesii 1704]|uniref:Glycosyltransferase family 69 protein n=1 Tax=Uncinocarpus reesii (strain UAMH 1704) TaxID=336963 RepID=C4JRF8_UNCRE|nr:uncharacterized protein UREG_05047 [Uncinocarpus reesii 1704]EEP80205.1 predicted protein [Uncinocarpus reesii 1704]